MILATIEPLQSLAIGTVEAFPLVLAALLAGYGLGLGHRISLMAAAGILACWLASLGWQGYGLLRQLLAGLDYLAMSLLVFAVAVLISLTTNRVCWIRLWRCRSQGSDVWCRAS